MQPLKGRRRMRSAEKTLIAVVVVMLSRGAPAWGGTASDFAGAALAKRFQEMDANGDGQITRAEYMDYETREASERFDLSDGNGDGFITRKEAERAMKKNQEEMRKRMQEWRQKQEKERRKP